MRIGIVPDPLNHPDWPQIKAFLEPAAKLGNRPVLRKWDVIWCVYDGQDLIGAANARLTDEGGEVALVGGREHRRWIGKLDWLITSWMRREGMKVVRAYGRKGWRKVLTDWVSVELEDGSTGYEKVL